MTGRDTSLVVPAAMTRVRIYRVKARPRRRPRELLRGQLDRERSRSRSWRSSVRFERARHDGEVLVAEAGIDDPLPSRRWRR